MSFRRRLLSTGNRFGVWLYRRSSGRLMGGEPFITGIGGELMGFQRDLAGKNCFEPAEGPG